MDASRPRTSTEPGSTPRQVVRGRDGSGKAIGTNAPAQPQARGRSLTPIKISGKGRSTHKLSSMMTQKPPFNTTYTKDQRIALDRRRWHPSHLSCSSSMRHQDAQRRSRKTPLRPLSRLESLPTEILQDIFLRTLSLSLPRASLALGQLLSSDYVYRELFLRTCSDPIANDNILKSPCSQRGDLRETQSFIVRQQWLTVEFVRRCIPDYLTSVLLHELAHERLHWLDHTGPLVTPELEPTIRKYILTHFERSRPSHECAHILYIEQQWDDIAPLRRIVLGLSVHTGMVTLHIHDAENPPTIIDDRFINPSTYQRWRILSLDPAVQIPTHLLRGPWTTAKIELLELLLRGGASVDWIYTTAGETAERGFYDALKENNSRALRALCISDNDTTPGERKDASYTVVPSRGVGIVPNQKHLLLALEQGCQEDVVETLLNAPESTCDLQDPTVVRGIYEMEKRGWLERAKWLAERRDVDRLRRTIPTGNWKDVPGRRNGWLRPPPELPRPYPF